MCGGKQGNVKGGRQEEERARQRRTVKMGRNRGLRGEENDAERKEGDKGRR